MEQTFINDIINTNEITFLPALKKLLKLNNLDDNIFDVFTLLDSYKLPDTNIHNIAVHYLNEDNFDISSYEMED